MWGNMHLNFFKIFVIGVLIYFVSACSGNLNSTQMNKISTVALGLSSEYSRGSEYVGEVTQIVEPIYLELRPFGQSNISWLNYEDVRSHELIVKTHGTIQLNQASGGFEEILRLKEISGSSTPKYPFKEHLIEKPPYLTNLVVTATKDVSGSITSLNLENKTGQIDKLHGVRYIKKIFESTSAGLYNAPVLSGEISETPIYYDEESGLKIGTLLHEVKGRTIWQDRPTILISLAGQMVISDRSYAAYKSRISGYVLIDEYTGSVVMIDHTHELYGEPSAHFFRREFLKIDLKSDTPIKTDQFAFFTKNTNHL